MSTFAQIRDERATAIPVSAGNPMWHDALTGLPHDIYHLPAYADLEAREWGGVATCCIFSDGCDMLLLPLVLTKVPTRPHRMHAASPYGYPGPVATTGDSRFWAFAMREVVSTLAERGVITCFLRLHPILSPPAAFLGDLGTLVQHGETVAMDLTQEETEIWRQIRGNHRRHINRARRMDRTVVIDDWSHLPVFRELYVETMQRVGAADRYYFPASYFTGLRTALGERLHLACVLRDEEVMCGALLTECGGIVQYHLGATADRCLDEQPIKLLFDEVWRWARSRGNSWFHLGGGVGGAADSLLHFKAGFSEVRFRFSTARIVLDAEEYGELSGSPPASGHFPGYPTCSPAR